MRDELLQILAGAPFIFGDVALRVFARQYAACAPYRRFCDARGKTPDTVTDWQQIPHLPVTAFKHARIYSGEGEPATYFQTSGTTEGPDLRGRHWFENLDLYRACAVPVFKRFVLPDVDRMPLFMLQAHPDVNPHSSLSRYLLWQEESFGVPGKGGWFVDANGLQVEKLIAALESASADGPVALLGTAFALVHLVDSGAKVKLPKGSRFMETGGFKGKSREVTRAELYDLVREALGEEIVGINQYGMTEMSSNCYDQTLVTGSARKGGPGWVAVQMLDPETLEPVPDGQPGVVAIADLANLHSCAFLLTQDIGINYPDGFEILGRAPGAEAKGCSIALDEFLAVNRHG